MRARARSQRGWSRSMRSCRSRRAICFGSILQKSASTPTYRRYGTEVLNGLCRTEVGLIAEEIVAAGGLLPDDIMLKVVTSKLDMLHNKVRATRVL